MVFGNLFRGPTKKEKQREQIRQNRENGRSFEDTQDMYHQFAGRKIEKLRKGPDRRITEVNPLTGRKRTWYEEYKSSSTAPLRPSQKRFQKKHPRKMKVIRPYDPFSGYSSSGRKKKSDNIWNIGSSNSSFLNSDSKKRRRKSDDWSIW